MTWQWLLGLLQRFKLGVIQARATEVRFNPAQIFVLEHDQLIQIVARIVAQRRPSPDQCLAKKAQKLPMAAL
jgi:hypothetical protein